MSGYLILVRHLTTFVHDILINRTCCLEYLGLVNQYFVEYQIGKFVLEDKFLVLRILAL